MSLVEIRDLTVSFGQGPRYFRALDRLCLEVGVNEAVGIVGESGSGKTIAAHSIMGLLPKEACIESGSIFFRGHDIVGMPGRALNEIRGRELAIIFQEPFTSLNPVMPVGRQVEEMFATHTGLAPAAIRQKSLALLEKVRLRDPGTVYGNYPHQLSGGERQRVMIAMAIALDPKLLIADEPTTALDVTVQSDILKLLRDLKDDLGIAILFITHDFGIVNEMADRIAVMKNGVIVESGDKENILKSPRDAYTKTLIEAVPRPGRVSVGVNRIPREAIIETRSLSKSFAVERGFFKRETGNVHAVKNVSIIIERGTTVGLVGESGCGKSTLGRLILGLDEPDTGEILVNGRQRREVTRQALCKMLQIVFQDPYSSLDPRMRMGDIVNEGASLLSLPVKERQGVLKNVLEQVRLSADDLMKYPHQFSGGQRQRIAIARALMVRPEFLVLDEPVSSLDVLIQKDILDLLKQLKAETNLTYLLISHDLRVVESMADTVYVMHDGEIVEHGPVAAIYRNPASDYTKRLIASVPELPTL
ncbi:MAG: ABC transporter ATP-binding protein [Candidatus Omnitrophica bacterium]|nr:ABC transporter ATP-binding protein [Candidatus Omnitrophota bacterium]